MAKFSDLTRLLEKKGMREIKMKGISGKTVSLGFLAPIPSFFIFPMVPDILSVDAPVSVSAGFDGTRINCSFFITDLPKVIEFYN